MVPGRPVESTRLLSAPPCCRGGCGTLRTQGAPAVEPERYALLVGVGNYRWLAPRFQLKGPPNDMRVMKSALEGAPFRLKAGQITVLTDWQTEKNLQPTRANIEREFVRLAEAAHKGDQSSFSSAATAASSRPIKILPISSQTGSTKRSCHPTFWLGRQEGQSDQRHRGRRDQVWVDRIRNTGAFVWIAFDSCHSGTMIRGAPADCRTGAAGADGGTGAPDWHGRAIRLEVRQRSGQLCCRSRERLRRSAWRGRGVRALRRAVVRNDTRYRRSDLRLLTSTLVEVLTQARSALTYRELTERITERYRVAGRIAPTPMFEGTGVDREVLGQTTWPDRPQSTLCPRRASRHRRQRRTSAWARLWARCSRSSRRPEAPTRHTSGICPGGQPRTARIGRETCRLQFHTECLSSTVVAWEPVSPGAGRFRRSDPAYRLAAQPASHPQAPR